LDNARVVVAVRDCILESRDVPAVYKITMIAVTGIVTHGPDERLFVAVPIEAGGVPDDFVKDGDEALGVACWAGTSVGTGGVGHVGFVVGRVEVDAVPAGGEEDLRAESIRALDIGETVCFRGGGPKTSVVDGVLLEGVIVTAECWGACYHAETFWEGEKSTRVLWIIWVGTL
jgi:hypothetical protein